ncbi:MAG: TonB-dependent receptor [Agriterribacter sp.]
MKGGIFNNLKLRASTGSTGNQAIAPYQSLYLASVALTGQGAGTGTNVGLAPNLPNPNLTWETTVQTNLGLDLGILNDKYRFSFDYYIKNTHDLLATVNLPQSSGFSTIVDNVGSVRNKGVKTLLGVDIINNENLRFSVDAQASRNTNVVVKTKDGEDIIVQSEASRTSNIVREGASLFS